MTADLNMESWQFVVRSAAGEDTVSLRELSVSPVFQEVVRRAVGEEALKRLTPDEPTEADRLTVKVAGLEGRVVALREQRDKAWKRNERLKDDNHQLRLEVAAMKAALQKVLTARCSAPQRGEEGR